MKKATWQRFTMAERHYRFFQNECRRLETDKVPQTRVSDADLVELQADYNAVTEKVLAGQATPEEYEHYRFMLVFMQTAFQLWPEDLERERMTASRK